MIRYLFAALGSATVLPAVEKIGVGWFSTISAAFLVTSSLATAAAVKWGRGWREGVDAKKRAQRKKVADGGKEKDVERGVEVVDVEGTGKEKRKEADNV
jgi:hypothetical protein